MYHTGSLKGLPSINSSVLTEASPGALITSHSPLAQLALSNPDTHPTHRAGRGIGPEVAPGPPPGPATLPRPPKMPQSMVACAIMQLSLSTILFVISKALKPYSNLTPPFIPLVTMDRIAYCVKVARFSCRNVQAIQSIERSARGVLTNRQQKSRITRVSSYSHQFNQGLAASRMPDRPTKIECRGCTKPIISFLPPFSSMLLFAAT